jgi:hypothetical protein
LIFLSLVFVPAFVRAGEPFRFPEGKHGKGELKYRNGLAVLTVAGTPEEIGEQVAVLAVKPAVRLLDYPREALTAISNPTAAKLAWPLLVQRCPRLLDNFPPDRRREFDAMVKAGLNREALMIGNTIFDLKSELAALFHCSALVVEAERSRTGQPLFGRNMDYLSLGYLHQYTLVTVYHPQGKHAIASIGYAGMIGCLSGINDAGLALTVLETTGSDRSEGPAFNPEGIPFGLCYRRLLEECTSIAEAEVMLRGMKRTTTNNLTLCDRHGCAVLEVTPSRVAVRRPQRHCAICTNHFCCPELKLSKPRNDRTTLDRFATLEKVQDSDKKLGIAEVQHCLDAVNQGKHTLQTMIFEPVSLTLHLATAVGDKPSSAQPLKRLELASLLKANH